MATKGKILVSYALRYSEATGSNRYIANTKRYSTIAYRDILQYAAKAAHVPESSIDVAMDALFDALSYFVLNGHNVKIEGLGTFYFGVNAYAMTDEADAGADAVHRLKVGYLPETSLRDALNNVAIEVSVSNPNALSEDASVPARVDGAYYSDSSSESFSHTLKYGKQVGTTRGQLYLAFNGVRMSRNITATGSALMRLGEPGNYTYQVDNAISIETVKHNAKWLVVKVTSNVANANAMYLMSIGLVDGSTGIFSQAYSTPSDANQSAGYRNATIDNGVRAMELSSTAQNAISSTGYKYLKIYGYNLDRLEPTFEGATAELTHNAQDALYYTLSEINGTVTVTVKDGITLTLVYPNNGGGGGGSSETPSPVITSLTANGVSINNGGSSTVTAGSNYAFVLAGSNLANLTAANISVPSGSSISNFAASASQVNFTLVNAAAGEIAVNYGGSKLFGVTVTEYSGEGEGGVTIDTIARAANNGSYSLTNTRKGEDMGFSVKGTGLSNLTADNFKLMMGNNVLEATFVFPGDSDTSRTLHLTSNVIDDGAKLVVQVDGTTVFTLNFTGHQQES